jgi:hypothetical protein
MTINKSKASFTQVLMQACIIAFALISSERLNGQNGIIVSAGRDTAICRNASLELSRLNARITGEVTDGTWFTNGDGRFLPSNANTGQFSTTLTYRPGSLDISRGYVDLTLVSFDPDGLGPKVQVSDQVRISLMLDPPMVCNTNLNVSLAANCSQEIFASMLIVNLQGNVNDYSVTLTSNGVKLPSNVITKEFIGKQLEFKVQHKCGSNNCWGYITAHDKEAPRLDCRDTTIDCTTSKLPDTIGFPLDYTRVTLIGLNRYELTNSDNCGKSTLFYRKDQ